MDFFDRRILRRLERQLPMSEGEELLDFEVGTTRPLAALPPPFPVNFSENARVEIAVSDRALYFRVNSRTFKGDAARVPLDRVESFGPYKAPEGKWKRWSLKGRLVDGSPIQATLLGKPRASMVATLEQLLG